MLVNEKKKNQIIDEKNYYLYEHVAYYQKEIPNKIEKNGNKKTKRNP